MALGERGCGCANEYGVWLSRCVLCWGVLVSMGQVMDVREGEVRSSECVKCVLGVRDPKG